MTTRSRSLGASAADEEPAPTEAGYQVEFGMIPEAVSSQLRLFLPLLHTGALRCARVAGAPCCAAHGHSVLARVHLPLQL